MSVDEALYILGKNLLGQNVTDRLFPIAKQVVTGFNQVGEGLSTIGGVLPPVALPTGKLITTLGSCEGKSITRHWEDYCCILDLPATPCSQSWTL